ncbi:MAG: hypothetical protein IPP72_13945 [Chitinophagaceae bacterium]|nr:hypothetical protein [Chitinophagaceae bacterium]
MRKTNTGYAIFAFLFLVISCQKVNAPLSPKTVNEIAVSTLEPLATALAVTSVENFETGVKTAYATANVTLATGSWSLNDALLGTSTSDRKNGAQSARVRNTGILSANFDYSTGASTVTVAHALYGTDASSTWQLWYSTNGGTSYTQTGGTITTSSTTLQTAGFTINVAGNIRFQIRKTGGTTNRICFDDFSVTDYTTPSTAPTLTSISPSSAIAGSAAFTLTATGTNFISGSTIDWNGTALTTTFVSATSLTASVPAANIATAGSSNITVTTAGVGTSAAVVFTTQAVSVPALSSISPNTAVAGGAGFTLTATGTNFTAGSVINWNGAALATSFVSSTSLTAAVASTNIAAAGSASVTVVTGSNVTGAVTFTITAASTVKRFLFDASQGETAGNADWVIDEDNSTPQRVPTPAQSGITATTSGTYWTGAISSWGVALVKAGNFVETLPSGGTITYGNASNAQDLSRYDVFVVDEPNIRFTAAEKVAILTFVQNGGGLFMIADHTISDRNNDGWDSPAIWNDLMTNNTVQNNPFGFSIDLTNISQVSGNVLTGNSTNPILHGTQGNVTQMEFNNGATLTLQPAVNSTVQGLIWQNTFAQGSTKVMAASPHLEQAVCLL